MEKRVAGFIAAPLWNAFLKEIFKELPLENFKSPVPQNPSKPVLNGMWQGGRAYKIDKISGKLATEFTPEELTEEKVIREIHSILFWVDKNDPLGPAPASPANDAQFANWENIVRKWAEQNGLRNEDEGVIPDEFDDLHRPEFIPKANFVEPVSENLHPGSKVKVSLQINSRFPVEQVDFFWGTKYLGSSRAAPFEFSFDADGEPGEIFEFSARIYDVVRNKNTISKIFKVSEN